MTIAELCAAHERIGLDSNLLIYVTEDTVDHLAKASAVLDAVAAGDIQGVLSVIGLAEVLMGPSLREELAVVEQIAAEIRATPNLRVVPVTPEIAVDAAVVGALRAVKLPDAIHLATARAARATAFVTNDRRLRTAPRLEVIYLDDIELGDGPAA